MGTLERMDVIRRERRRVEGMQGPGMAVYFINPQVAWNGKPGTFAKPKLRKSSPPLLRLVGGKMRKAAKPTKPALRVVPGVSPT